jgi:hypothetical protein
MPKLKSLDISGCNTIGYSWIMNSGSKASCLRQLKAEDTDWWCFDAFNALTSFRDLRLISVSRAKDFSGPDPGRIARFLPRLRSISLADCAVRPQARMFILICVFLFIFQYFGRE